MRRGISTRQRSISVKKTLAVAAALTMTTALALTGCGGGGETKPESSGTSKGSAAADAGKITLWVDTNRQPAIAKIAEKFKQDTGVTVELVVKDNSKIVDDFTTQAPSGNGPDAIILAHDNVGRLVQNGVIEAIELGAVASKFQPVTVKAFTLDGKVYGLPYATENLALVRNTDLVKQAPKTWDEAVELGKASGAAYPILVGGDDSTKASPYNLYAFQQSFGAPVFSLAADGSYDPTKIAMGGQPGADFANWVSAQGKAGILRLSIDNDVAISEFTAGKSPYIVTGPWNLEKIKTAGIKYAIDPIPAAGPQAAAPFVGVQGMAMSAYSKNKIATQKFLAEYMSQESVQMDLFNALHRPPALTSAFEKAKSDADVAGFGAVGAKGVPMPNVPAMNGVWNDWGNALTEIVEQKTANPAETWQKMVDAQQAKLK